MDNWFLRISRLLSSPGLSSNNLTSACVVAPDRLYDELELEHKAMQAGSKELPATQAITPDGNERAIMNYFEQRMAVINKIANDGLSRRNTSIADTHLEDERAEITNQTNHIKLEIESLMSREFRELQTLRRERDELEDEFRQFRRANKLDRIPHYPDSQLLNFAIILLFWLVESAGNGYFFAEGSELGLLGGVAQAVIIAAINIATAFFIIGTIVRYKNHVSWWKRLCTYIGLLIYGGAAVAFNLLVAHYRDLFAVNPASAGNQALQQFKENPLTLADFNSWMLFCMGLLFSVFALIDGYKRDDPYPGYGKLHRRLRELFDNYEEQRDDVIEQIETIRRDFLGRLERMKQAVAMKHTRLVHLVEEKQAFIAEYQHGIANFITCANALIHRYRDINRAHRRTPPPDYFQSDWEPKRTFILRGAHDDIELVNAQQELFRNFPAYCQHRANEIEQLYVLFFDKLRQMDPNFRHTRTKQAEE
ncbi:hypothetical protein [Methylomarinum vadi]|uniref:hypothetical protein n=1 Tax=Methylomarinum vadi TaxID=438855 RepID=UPI0004DED490|nr:hypothetical protein [Methylomarinum vadi]